MELYNFSGLVYGVLMYPSKFSAELSDFSFDVCLRRDTGLVYSMKRTKTTLGSPPREKLILEALTERRVPFVSHLRWIIQDGDQMCLVTVSLLTFSPWISFISFKDYYPKGNLFEYVHQYGALGPLRTVFYASELVRRPVYQMLPIHDVRCWYSIFRSSLFPVCIASELCIKGWTPRTSRLTPRVI